MSRKASAWTRRAFLLKSPSALGTDRPSVSVAACTSGAASAFRDRGLSRARRDRRRLPYEWAPPARATWPGGPARTPSALNADWSFAGSDRRAGSMASGEHGRRDDWVLGFFINLVGHERLFQRVVVLQSRDEEGRVLVRWWWLRNLLLRSRFPARLLLQRVDQGLVALFPELGRRRDRRLGDALDADPLEAPVALRARGAPAVPRFGRFLGTSVVTSKWRAVQPSRCCVAVCTSVLTVSPVGSSPVEPNNGFAIERELLEQIIPLSRRCPSRFLSDCVLDPTPLIQRGFPCGLALWPRPSRRSLEWK